MIHECEEIGTVCCFMMVHRGDEGNEEYVLSLLSFRKVLIGDDENENVCTRMLWTFDDPNQLRVIGN